MSTPHLQMTGEHFRYWFPRPDLRILVLWGTPDEHDLHCILEAIRVEFTMPRHHAIIDISRVDHVLGLLRLLVLSEPFIETHLDGWRRSVDRGALVHRSRVTAASALGYLQLFGMDVSSRRDFWSLRDAVMWLVEDSACADEVSRLAVQESRSSDAATLERMRAWLAHNLDSADISTCARAMGTSCRTLQRVLRSGQTSFRQELTNARMDQAKILLRASRAKLEHVAADVGLASAQSLIELFRRRAGVSPSIWRLRADPAA